jgi:hypothetical protein
VSSWNVEQPTGYHKVTQAVAPTKKMTAVRCGCQNTGMVRKNVNCYILGTRITGNTAVYRRLQSFASRWLSCLDMRRKA